MRYFSKAVYVFLLLPIIVPSAIVWTVWNAVMAGKEIAYDIANWIHEQ